MSKKTDSKHSLLEKIEIAKTYRTRRKEPRIPISHLHEVSFVDKSGKNYSVFSISPNGIGLIGEQNNNIKSGDQINGSIVIANKIFPSSIEIRYGLENFIGCQINEIEESFLETISNYFEAELLAVNLIPSEDKIEENIFEFRGQNNCEVALKLNENELISFKILFFGNIFEGGESKMFTAGKIVSNTEFDKFDTGMVKKLYRALNEISPEFASTLHRFIYAIEFIEDHHKNFICNQINKLIKK